MTIRARPGYPVWAACLVRRTTPRQPEGRFVMLSAWSPQVEDGPRQRLAKVPLFQSANRSGRLSGRPLPRRAAAAAGLPASTCSHTFRATGIVARYSFSS